MAGAARVASVNRSIPDRWHGERLDRHRLAAKRAVAALTFA
jgi:hypothetical protein